MSGKREKQLRFLSPEPEVMEKFLARLRAVLSSLEQGIYTFTVVIKTPGYPLLGDTWRNLPDSPPYGNSSA